jgi:hypothetical protein
MRYRRFKDRFGRAWFPWRTAWADFVAVLVYASMAL